MSVFKTNKNSDKKSDMSIMEKNRNPKTTQQYPWKNKIITKTQNNNLQSVIDKIENLADKDFKNILVKMINEKKSLIEVCKEAGLPHPGTISKYAKKNAKFRKELEMTYGQLPNSVQAYHGKLPENKLKEDPLSLKKRGIRATEMSRGPEVPKSMINNELKAATANISSDNVRERIDLPHNDRSEKPTKN